MTVSMVAVHIPAAFDGYRLDGFFEQEGPRHSRYESTLKRSQTQTIMPDRICRPLQQTTLGFFDVPDSMDVAVQRRAGTKRKHKASQSSSVSRNKLTINETKSAPRTSAKTKKDVPKTETTKNSPTNESEASSSTEEQNSFQKATTLLHTHEVLKSGIMVPVRNIALQLQQRALQGLSCPTKPISTPPLPWSTASWLKFQCPRSGNPLTGACILEWDPMGILLAVMTCHDSILRVYDWDTVYSSDVKGRNHRVRRKTNLDADYTGGSFRVDATLSINVGIRGSHYQKLAWNPFNPDQIAILDR